MQLLNVQVKLKLQVMSGVASCDLENYNLCGACQVPRKLSNNISKWKDVEGKTSAECLQM